MRGVALFGVLLVNLLTLFRVSLFHHLLNFHTEPGSINHLVDVLADALLEFKAFTLFSFLFGLGVGIQTERSASRSVNSFLFLFRRFVILLGFGLVHMVLVWNGDILCLYAVCGLLLLGFLEMPTGLLVILGLGFIALNFTPVFDGLWPQEQAMRDDALQASNVYATGSFVEILIFRQSETLHFILPLLMGCLPRTLGLMILGIAAWRGGIIQAGIAHRRWFRMVAIGSGAIGAIGSALAIYSTASGRSLGIPAALVNAGSFLPLSLAYAMVIFAWSGRAKPGVLRVGLAAAGRMALTNYLAQSVILAILFYGYGFGLFGKLGSASAALIGFALYGFQVVTSRWWLATHQFGPFEWLWRSLTYGWRQPMRTDQGLPRLRAPPQ